jgi:hypothetical protein
VARRARGVNTLMLLVWVGRELVDKAMGFWILEQYGPFDVDLDGGDGTTAFGVYFGYCGPCNLLPLPHKEYIH